MEHEVTSPSSQTTLLDSHPQRGPLFDIQLASCILDPVRANVFLVKICSIIIVKILQR